MRTDLAISQGIDLYAWQSPQTMRTAVDLLDKQLGWDALRRAGRDFREAFVASRFAAHLSADEVRLIEPTAIATPDFAIRLAGQERWYETTEADRPGRKRGEEPALHGVESVPDHHWVEPEVYFNVIQERTRSKASKPYERCDGLVIWSNAFPISEEHRLDMRWWTDATEPAKARFREIWVHFGHRFFQVQ